MGRHGAIVVDAFLEEMIVDPTAVFAIGLDPRFADFTAMPQLTSAQAPLTLDGALSWMHGATERYSHRSCRICFHGGDLQ